MARHWLLLWGGIVLGLGLFRFSVGAAPGAPERATVAQRADASVTSTLAGSIRAADGKALDGVPVSAQAVDKTITTTVFTDEQGQYFFPTLESGPHRVWAQAVGYETARAHVTLDTTRQTRQAFTLITIRDFTLQLSGSEWMAALPEDTRERRRMKEIFRVNCTICHSAAAVLQHRFDEPGWLAMVEVMIRFNPSGGQVDRRSTIEYHKTELAKYLATVRGPGPSPLKFKMHPRPTGDAARVVMTQYDIPVVDQPDGLAWFDGSDWSEGRATHRGYWTHDIAVDLNGYVWVTSFQPEHSLVKLNPQTGQVRWFKILGPDGVTSRATHGIRLDQKGILWFTPGGPLGRLDPAAETFEFFTPPRPMGSPFDADADAHGKIWSPVRYGATRFDPDTKKWKYLQNVTVADGFSYGGAGDADGNGWWAQWNADRVGKGNPETGKSYEVVMRPPWMKNREDVTTPADREFYESIGAELGSGQYGPGRAGAAPDGGRQERRHAVGGELPWQQPRENQHPYPRNDVLRAAD